MIYVPSKLSKIKGKQALLWPGWKIRGFRADILDAADFKTLVQVFPNVNGFYAIARLNTRCPSLHNRQVCLAVGLTDLTT